MRRGPRALFRAECRLRFEPRDLWVGVYWEREHWPAEVLEVFICLVPCFPPRLRWAFPCSCEA